MFEVDVKNVMEEGRRRGGPAWVWGSDFVIDRVKSFGS